MICLAKNIIEFWANETDVASLKYNQSESNEESIILSLKYPNVSISTLLKFEIMNGLKRPPGDASSTSLFRKLIGHIIPDTKEWATREVKRFMRDFKDQVMAAFGII